MPGDDADVTTGGNITGFSVVPGRRRAKINIAQGQTFNRVQLLSSSLLVHRYYTLFECANHHNAFRFLSKTNQFMLYSIRSQKSCFCFDKGSRLKRQFCKLQAMPL